VVYGAVKKIEAVMSFWPLTFSNNWCKFEKKKTPAFQVFAPKRLNTLKE
jgi:hypothetical protein